MNETEKSTRISILTALFDILMKLNKQNEAEKVLKEIMKLAGE